MHATLYHPTVNSSINSKPYYITQPRKGVHGFYYNHESMDYKLIYKPFTILEAITLTINVISMCISSPKIVCSSCSVEGSPVPQPIEYHCCQSQIPFPMGTKAIHLFTPRVSSRSHERPKWFTSDLRHKLNCVHSLRRKQSKKPSANLQIKLADAELSLQKDNYDCCQICLRIFFNT